MGEEKNIGITRANRMMGFFPVILSAGALIVSAVGLFRVASLTGSGSMA